MARTGRPRKPTAMHLLQGTWRADRHNYLEPQPAKVRPKRPRYFQGERRKLWNAVVKQQAAVGILAEMDGGVIERLVNWSTISREAHEKLAALTDVNGKLQRSASGYVNIDALVILARLADEMAHKCETELGRTPVARTKIKVEPRRHEDAFEDFVQTKRKQLAVLKKLTSDK